MVDFLVLVVYRDLRDVTYRLRVFGSHYRFYAVLRAIFFVCCKRFLNTVFIFKLYYECMSVVNACSVCCFTFVVLSFYSSVLCCVYVCVSRVYSMYRSVKTETHHCKCYNLNFFQA